VAYQLISNAIATRMVLMPFILLIEFLLSRRVADCSGCFMPLVVLKTAQVLTVVSGGSVSDRLKSGVHCRRWCFDTAARRFTL
jgi:hypothetical protein